jgi:isoleucyl-tRNA synthetase
MSDRERKEGEKAPAYEKVSSWVDIVALEHEVLRFWEETNAFERLREQNADGEIFSFLDGPITANNPMGVHHAWGRTLKDAYQRFWAMHGRRLRYQNGFDCQGLWVEVEVEKEHGFRSKREIEEYGIERFVEDCKARVRKYSAIQTQQSIRLGMWMDWANSYYTMSDENNYTIWKFLKKCHERGKIYRGTDVMPWSGRSGTGYSQMEIIEGRKLVAHVALFLRFPLIDRENEYLLVWTTTPWTLTANVAAMVNTELEYVKLRSRKDGALYYFAAENLEYPRLRRQYEEGKEWIEGVPPLKTIAEIFEEQGGYEIEGYIKGAEMVGWRYVGPFDELEAQHVRGGYPFVDSAIAENAVEAHRVIDGGRDSKGNPIVVVGEGTGIVHTAPGCGDIDHQVGKQLGLPQIAPLDAEAKFIEKFGFLTGRHALAKDVVDDILESLRQKGYLVHTELYPHVYPHCWRSGDELVFRLVDEWYIKMDWRDEIIAIVDDIRWIPAYGRDREIEWLTNMRDWMISKKRYWGLALPIWVCEKCDHFDVIGGYEELKERAIAGWEEFEGHSPHRPWIDKVKIACSKCGGTASRIPDVGNPWLDAGIVPYSTTRYNQDREFWRQWIPADLVLECFPGQFRNWFYSLLAMSTMMEGIAPFKTLLGHALVRDEEGKEMHKSAGNAIWFDDAAEQAGADVMRWLFVSHDPTTNLNFGFNILREVRGKFLNKLWNTYGFYVNYARIEGYVPPREPIPFEELSDFDRWILTELQRTIGRCDERIADYDMRAAARAIEAFLEDLSNWYIRHNRRRFWKKADEADARAAFATLYECLDALIRLAAPMIPFVTEKMYQNLVRPANPDAPVSVHLTRYPAADPRRMDEPLADEMRAVIRLNGLALSARGGRGIKLRQPLARLTIGPGSELERRAALRFRKMLEEDLNVKSVEVLDVGAPSPLTYTVTPNFKTLGKRFGRRMRALAAEIERQADDLLQGLRSGKSSFVLDVEGEPARIEAEDLKVRALAPEGLAAAEDGDTWVAFDTLLDEALIIEGLMRDVLRKLQVARKEMGLEIEDRIRLKWDARSPEMEKVFDTWAPFMGSELLALEITRAPGLEGQTLKVGKHVLQVEIARAAS